MSNEEKKKAVGDGKNVAIDEVTVINEEDPIAKANKLDEEPKEEVKETAEPAEVPAEEASTGDEEETKEDVATDFKIDLPPEDAVEIPAPLEAAQTEEPAFQPPVDDVNVGAADLAQPQDTFNSFNNFDAQPNGLDAQTTVEPAFTSGLGKQPQEPSKDENTFNFSGETIVKTKSVIGSEGDIENLKSAGKQAMNEIVDKVFGPVADLMKSNREAYELLQIVLKDEPRDYDFYKRAHEWTLNYEGKQEIEKTNGSFEDTVEPEASFTYQEPRTLEPQTINPQTDLGFMPGASYGDEGFNQGNILQ